MKLIDTILDGMFAMADAALEPNPYRRPASGGYLRDLENLADDVKHIGSVMTRAIANHGRADNRSRMEWQRRKQFNVSAYLFQQSYPSSRKSKAVAAD